MPQKFYRALEFEGCMDMVNVIKASSSSKPTSIITKMELTLTNMVTIVHGILLHERMTMYTFY
jgi:hypothetical protein